MKVKSLVFVLALTACSVALADEPAKSTSKAPQPTRKPKLEAPNDAKEVELTGSYIKRKVRRDGMITDGPNQVVVVDRTMIERSGAADLKQVLIRRGIH
jgi:hypothetical protein